MPHRKFFPGMVFLVVWAAFALTGMRLLVEKLAGTPVADLHSLVLPAVLVGSYAVNWLLLKRSRTLPLLVAVNVVLYALSTWAVVETAVGLTLGWFVYTLAVSALLQAMSCVYAIKSPPDNRYLRMFEISSVVMLVFVLYSNYQKFAPMATLPIYLAFVLSLGLIVYRRLAGAFSARSGSRTRSFSLILAFGAGVVLAGIFMVTFFAGPLANGMVQLWEWLMTACKWLLGLLFAAVDAFMSLFHFAPSEQTALPEMAGPGDTTVELPLQMAMQAVPVELVLIVLGAAAVLVLAWLTFRYRKKIHGGFSITVGEKNSRVQREKGSFRQALSAAAERMKQALRREWLALRHRNDPAGLLLDLQRICKHGVLRRQNGETTHRFLHRLADGMPEARKKSADELRALAAYLDSFFFSAEDVRVVPRLHPVRIRHAVRRLKREETRRLRALHKQEAATSV